MKRIATYYANDRICREMVISNDIDSIDYCTDYLIKMCEHSGISEGQCRLEEFKEESATTTVFLRYSNKEVFKGFSFCHFSN